MKKFLAALMIIALSFASISTLAPADAYAAGEPDCEKSFLGLRPWYSGLTKKENGRCVVMSPAELKVSDSNTNNNNNSNASEDSAIAVYVWTIVLNVLSDLFAVIGYLALGFIIYGGYLYIFSQGEPANVAKGKNTIIRAVAGIAIAMLASVICNLIVGLLVG